jgi:23S rRNA pseudouridine2605 synthase
MARKGTLYRTGLARALSKLGYCSRAVARNLIASGQVSLNGRVARDPYASVRLETDRIEVSGERVGRAKNTYLMLNKPRGIVTTARDERGRETVYSLLPEYRQWLAPVGRLDKASEGLLLFTNDSHWAAKISAPGSHIEKTYHVQIHPIPGEQLLKDLRTGIHSNGERLAARPITLLRSGEKNCWIEVVLEEGKNRHIRRMLAACGIEVLRLIRISIGPLRLGNLQRGKVRELTPAEIRALNELPVVRRHHNCIE